MGLAKKIGLGSGIAVIAFFGLVVDVALNGDLEEKRINVIGAIAGPTNTYVLGESFVIDGMSYTVTGVGVTNAMPGINLWTDKSSQILFAAVEIENISKDPKNEFTNFSLTDAKDRRYTGYYAGSQFGDNPGIIQPGLKSKSPRYAMFEIPFDPDMLYYLVAGDSIITLGVGNTFNIDEQVKEEIGIK